MSDQVDNGAVYHHRDRSAGQLRKGPLQAKGYISNEKLTQMQDRKRPVLETSLSATNFDKYSKKKYANSEQFSNMKRQKFISRADND